MIEKSESQFKQIFPFDNSEEMKKKVSYIVTMGGDGTILWAAKQFSGNELPPIITFAQGSLGFMCNFVFDDFKEVMNHVFESVKTGKKSEHLGIDSRLRLRVSMGPGCNPVRKVFRGDQLDKTTDLTVDNFHVVNEIVIDRGPSPYAVQLDIYIDNTKFTTCFGDGIIIATPTGSTAYSMSAGGSIVQVNNHCICVTPLAPHSLSFRPIILPSSSEIRMVKPKDSRAAAWVSLDGATRFKLEDGESVTIQGSNYPLNMVTLKSDNLTDLWAQRLTNLFGWNMREPIKPLVKSKIEESEDRVTYGDL